MEFKARYELIGAFTLAVIAAVFLFVYWLNNGGSLGEHTVYKVRFEKPASGLLVGGGVFFNGIRVGEITKLALDPQKPNRLNATISIKKETPVRADTKIGIDYQGLTGIAGISLTGGSSTAPILTAKRGGPALLTASSSAGNNWTQSANQVLTQFEQILADNKQPLNDTMKNIATFSEVLSQNKNRLENILAGLEKMTGGSAKPTDKIIYDLMPPTQFQPLAGKPDWRLVINEPTVLLALNTDKIQQRPNKSETLPLGKARWSDNLPNLFQGKLIQSFENAGYASAILRPMEGMESDHKLLIDIRGFHLSTEKSPTAEIEFTAKLMNGSGTIIAARLFKSMVPTEKSDAAKVASALGQAFSQSATDLINWTAGHL